MKMVFHNQFGITFKKRNATFDFKKNLIYFKEAYQFEIKLKINEGKEYISKYDFSLKVKKDNKPKNNLSKINFRPKYIIFFEDFRYF